MSTIGRGDTTHRPRLQIGLPVFNGAKYLAEALDSLLAQTFGDFEILISDNGSTDATRAVAERYATTDPRVRYFRYHVNRGAAWNFNNVVNLADAELFKWAAHDDVHAPTFLERCIDVLDAEPDVLLCCTSSTSIDAAGQPVGDLRIEHCDLREKSPAARFARTLGLYPMHVLFGVIRREELARTRLWGTAAASDRVLVSEIALHGQIREIVEPLFIRRWHPEVSWVLGTSDREYAIWYDPRNQHRRLTMPKLERGVSYAKAIAHANLPPLQAIRAYLHWLRYGIITYGAGAIAREVMPIIITRLSPDSSTADDAPPSATLPT